MASAGKASCRPAHAADQALEGTPNFAFRVSRLQFRIFLYLPAMIMATVEWRGFKSRVSQPGLLWRVLAFETTA